MALITAEGDLTGASPAMAATAGMSIGATGALTVSAGALAGTAGTSIGSTGALTVSASSLTGWPRGSISATGALTVTAGTFAGAERTMVGSAGALTGSAGDLTGAERTMINATGALTGSSGDLAGTERTMINATGALTVTAGDLAGSLPILTDVHWDFLEPDTPAEAAMFGSDVIRIDVTGSYNIIGKNLVCLCTTAWKYGGPLSTAIDSGFYVDVPANSYIPISMKTDVFTFYAKGTAGTFLTGFVTGL
ncbi:hypothetical protein MUP01_00725 [Candidatus Bathyarchaeota archaeon]|nr:hypothetical protein [Candidatus Bathyarchaeota archaeon]